MLITFLGACSLFDKPNDDSAASLLKKEPSQRIYFASYEEVWRAAHQVLKYPIAAENQDSGMIETEFVKIADGFQNPDDEMGRGKGTRYKIIMKINKGKINGRPSTRVEVEKQIQVLKDFFSEPQTLPSDGIEEKVIFYRIERELVIANALKKAN